MKSLMALVAAAVAMATVLLLSSCGSPASDGHADQQPAQSNAADVAFATGMIEHHQQAVRMSGLAPQRSTNPAVITLAAEISAAQGPEIVTMKNFLAQWNAQGHDGAMNGMEMQGMVDDATLTRLESLRGTEFDTLWLNAMIGHHEGAVGMAKTELADGANADAKALARQIITVQKAEIAQMTRMLGG